MIQIHCNLTSTSQQAFTLFEKSWLGEKEHGKILYSVYEAFYLIKTRRAVLIKNNKPILPEEAEKQLMKNKDIRKKYLVFKNLRKKGYVPKAGLKFGADFRLYIKNEKHAKYLVHITNENNKTGFRELLAKTRISHSTAKKLLIAIIDSQGDITYLEIDWIKI